MIFLYWQNIVQVILRPELINRFVKGSLRIISTIKGRRLLGKDDRPDRKISDHLPIYFEIKEEP